MIKIFNILIIICILIHQSNAQEADYKSALDNINRDIKLEMSELSELRQMIANERPKLAEKTEKIASELRDKRRRSQLASQERDALIHDLSSLSSEVRLWRDQSVYIENLLTDFRRNFETQMSVAEADSMRSLMLSSDKTSDDGLDSKLKILENAVGQKKSPAGCPDSKTKVVNIFRNIPDPNRTKLYLKIAILYKDFDENKPF